MMGDILQERKKMKSNRRSSILKKSPCRLPLDDLNSNSDFTDTRMLGDGKKVRRSAGRRVSFAEKPQIKEFNKQQHMFDLKPQGEEYQPLNLFGPNSSESSKDGSNFNIFNMFKNPESQGTNQFDLRKELGMESVMSGRQHSMNRSNARPSRKRKSFDINDFLENPDDDDQDEVEFGLNENRRDDIYETDANVKGFSAMNSTRIFDEDDMELTCKTLIVSENDSKFGLGAWNKEERVEVPIGEDVQIEANPRVSTDGRLENLKMQANKSFCRSEQWYQAMLKQSDVFTATSDSQYQAVEAQARRLPSAFVPTKQRLSRLDLENANKSLYRSEQWYQAMLKQSDVLSHENGTQFKTDEDLAPRRPSAFAPLQHHSSKQSLDILRSNKENFIGWPQTDNQLTNPTVTKIPFKDCIIPSLMKEHKEKSLDTESSSFSTVEDQYSEGPAQISNTTHRQGPEISFHPSQKSSPDHLDSDNTTLDITSIGQDKENIDIGTIPMIHVDRMVEVGKMIHDCKMIDDDKRMVEVGKMIHDGKMIDDDKTIEGDTMIVGDTMTDDHNMIENDRMIEDGKMIRNDDNETEEISSSRFTLQKSRNETFDLSRENNVEMEQKRIFNDDSVYNVKGHMSKVDGENIESKEQTVLNNIDKTVILEHLNDSSVSVDQVKEYDASCAKIDGPESVYQQSLHMETINCSTIAAPIGNSTLICPSEEPVELIHDVTPPGLLEESLSDEEDKDDEIDTDRKSVINDVSIKRNSSPTLLSLENDPSYKAQIEKMRKEKVEMETELAALNKALEKKEEDFFVLEEMQKDLKSEMKEMEVQQHELNEKEKSLETKEKELNKKKAEKEELKREKEVYQQKSLEIVSSSKLLKEKLAAKKKEEIAAEKDVLKLYNVMQRFLPWSISSLSNTALVIMFNDFRLTIEFEENNSDTLELLKSNTKIKTIGFEYTKPGRLKKCSKFIAERLLKHIKPDILLAKFPTAKNINELLDEISMIVLAHRELLEDLLLVYACNSLSIEDGDSIRSKFISPPSILYTEFYIHCKIDEGDAIPNLQFELEHVFGKDRTEMFQSIIDKTEPGSLLFSRVVQQMKDTILNAHREYFNDLH